jgi:predicted amidohydrolase
MELKMKVNVTCVQMEPQLFHVNENLDKMIYNIKKIMSDKPETNLIVFPELITTGYECGEEFQKLAETVPDGESIKRIGACAKEYGVNIVYGFPERDFVLTDILFNSTVFIDSDGIVAGVYRKVHLFGSEKNFFRPGCEYPIINTAIGKIGLMICWDTAFPEVARAYALQGAELLVISTNWEKPYEADWDLVTKARAFDNMIYIAAANRVGEDTTLGFFGHSKIISPLGMPIQELNEDVEGYISAQIDYELPLKLKAEYYTLFKDRRPDTYEIVCKKY